MLNSKVQSNPVDTKTLEEKLFHINSSGHKYSKFVAYYGKMFLTIVRK